MIDKKDEAFLDDLTGVYNRRFLKEYLSIEIKKYKRYYTPFTMLFLDIDNFKDVNDTKGHVEGDRILKAFVTFLKDYLRKSDILVRYGGDEFVVILPHTERNAGLIVAKRIIERVKQHEEFSSDGIGVSIGVAQYPDDGSGIDELLNAADTALYLAKKHGKGRVFFSSKTRLKPLVPPLRFVDRKKEFETLDITVKTKSNGLFLVHGDVGVGKTRFLKEFLSRMSREVYYGRGFSANHNFPYYVVRSMLKRLYSDRKSEFLNIFRELSPLAQVHIARLVPDLARVKQESDYKDEKEVFLHSVYTFFRDFSRDELVFAIDDIQWIDDESAQFMEYAYNTDKNVKIIGTHRVNEGSSGYKFIKEKFEDKLFELEIKPFDKSLVHDLVKAILGDNVTLEIVEFVFKNGGGNPFFIEEVIRALFDRGFLYTDNEGVWQLDDGAYREEVFTKNAEGIVRAKLRTLHDEHLKVLELVAVHGEPMTVGTLSHLLSLGEGELYSILDRIERAGLLMQEGYKTYLFPAGIIKEVVLQEISKGKRVYYHRKVLEYYEHFVPKSEREEKSAFLAYHYNMAGEKEMAAQFYRLAGENAMDVFAFEAAQTYFEESYNIIPNDEVKFKVSNALYYLGKFQESMAILEKLAEKYPDNFKYLLRLADVNEMLGKSEDALNIIDYVLKKAEDTETIISAKLLLAWIKQQGGEIKDALSIYDEIINYARKMKDEKHLAKALQEMGICYRRLGLLKDAEDCYLMALETDYAKKNHLFYLVTKFSLSSVIFNKGYLENAIDILRELKDEFKKIGAQYYYTVTLINLGAAYYNGGDTQKAGKYLETAKRYAEKIDNEYLLSYIYTNLASINFDLDDYSKAEFYLEEALKREKNTIDKLNLMLFLAVVYAHMGKFDGVHKLMEEYEKEKEGIENEKLLIHEFRRKLEVAEITDEDIALEYENKIKDILNSYREEEDLVYIALYMAKYFSKKKESDKAKEYLEDATKHFKDNPSFNVLDFHELLLEIYGYMGDRDTVKKEFNLLKEELLSRKNFKRLEKLERKMEDFFK